MQNNPQLQENEVQREAEDFDEIFQEDDDARGNLVRDELVRERFF